MPRGHLVVNGDLSGVAHRVSSLRKWRRVMEMRLAGKGDAEIAAVVGMSEKSVANLSSKPAFRAWWSATLGAWMLEVSRVVAKSAAAAQPEASSPGKDELWGK